MPSPCNPAIALLGISPNEVKTYLPTESCTQIFIAALFVIAQAWKQPRCPSVGEQTNGSTQTMGYCSQMRYQAMKRRGYTKMLREWLESFVGSRAETNQFHPPIPPATWLQPGGQGQHQQSQVTLIVSTLRRVWWKWYFTSMVPLPQTRNSSITMKKIVGKC